MLKNFLSKALMSMVLDEKARDKLAERKAVTAAAVVPSSRDEQIKKLQSMGKGMMTEDRAELIRNAMKVRQAKAKIFDDLDDEQKRKLYALAVKAFLGEGNGGK